MTLAEPNNILVIANPAARVGADRAIAALHRHKPPKSEMTVHYTKRGVLAVHDVGQLPAETDLVVAVGGDGIVSQAAGVIDHRIVPLGIVPGGSTNMIAKVSGVPSDPEAAAKLIFGSHDIEVIDVGISGDRRLLHAGGAGIDARIFANASTKLKQHVGWVAYLPAFARTVTYRASQVSLDLDGEVIEAESRFVFVCNSAALVLANFSLLPQATRSDGFLDVLVFTADDPLAIAATLSDFFRPGFAESPRVIYRRVKRLFIESDPAMPVEIDGDLAGFTPFQMYLRPKSLRLIVAPR